MSQMMYSHKMKMEAQMNKVNSLEEEKNQRSYEYDIKNKRVLPSQANDKKQKPPMSAQKAGKSIFKSRA